MGIVREAFIRMIQEQDTLAKAQHEIMSRGEPDRLWVSEIGRCIRKPFIRLSGAEDTHPFDAYTLELFHSGNVWESEIRKAFTGRLPGTVVGELAVGNDIWSGRIDLYLVELNAIIELKDTADHNFKARDRLPYLSHALQVMAYTKLLQEKWRLDMQPTASLYYHGRGNWAEFDLRQYDEGILFVGDKNNKEATGTLYANIDEEMARLESCWHDFQTYKIIPDPPYASPFEERFACLKAVKDLWYPACTYFGHCWPELARETPPYKGDDGWETSSDEI